MRSILGDLREVYRDLPPGASPEELEEFEDALGRRLPGALRSLYLDHNGEPRGLLEYRLLPLHDCYEVSEGVWCFWEYGYVPEGDGADYHLADGTVSCDRRTFPSVQAFLQGLLEFRLPAPVEIPPLPEGFGLADKLDCPERSAALIQAMQMTTRELAPGLLRYLQDDDEAVVIATCEWMARYAVTEAIRPLALVTGKPSVAASRALEALGARLLEVQAPFPVKFATLVEKWSGGTPLSSMTVLKSGPEAEWQTLSSTYSHPTTPYSPSSPRERPGMYFGSLTGDGTHQLAVEIIANSVDQFLQGHSTQVRVRHDEWTLEVEDDGLGYPLDSELGERYLTDYHNSPTVDHHAPHIHLVTHGVGLAPVNAVCSEYQVESVRNGQGYRLRYAQGERVSAEKTTLDFARGTRVRLTLDREIWPCGIQAGPLRRRLFDFVHLIPGLVLTLNQERFHAPAGLLDLAEFDLAETSERRFGYQGESDFLMLQVAATGESKRKIQLDSWVNGARTEEHGSHVDGALEAFAEIGWRPARVMVHVVMREPRYAGPVRRRLMVPKALRQVRQLLRAQLLAGTEQVRSPVPTDKSPGYTISAEP